MSERSDRKGIAYLCKRKDTLSVTSKNTWIFDTGTTSHLTGNREFFDTYNVYPNPRSIEIADGSTISAVGCGVIIVQAFVNNQWEDREMQNVWHAPELKTNLFSACASLAHGDVWKLINKIVTCERNNKIESWKTDLLH